MNYPIIIGLIIFILFFILKKPIAYGFLASAVFYYIVKGSTMGYIITKTIENYYSNYVMIAIPLFIFSANIMNTGKITDLIFGFVNAIVGKRKGGLGYVNVLASLVFAGMSGSAVADVAGLGELELKAMKEAGYDDGFSCAITAASATVGPIFPPSIPFVIYSMLANVSLAGLFFGGMIPAIIIVIALMIYVRIISHKRNYPSGEKYLPLRDFIFLFIKSFPSLLTPVIILSGMYLGVMTATEAAAVAGFYALIISFIVYRTLSLKDFLKVLEDTILKSTAIGAIVGMAAIISYILQREGVSNAVILFITNLTDNKYIFLLITNIIFLFLGTILDGSPILIIFVPLFIPVARNFGIELIHFGVMIVLNIMIGTITPPYGISLFIVSKVSKTKLQDVIKEIWWPIIVLILVLAIITYFPKTVQFLPSLLGYGGL